MIIRKISSWLELNKKFYRSSDLKISNKKKIGDDRLLEIIKSINGKTYFSGKGGSKYQDEEKFKSSDMTLKYLDFKEKEYIQLSNEFIYE